MSSQKWEVLYTESYEPKILINFNTMQIKMIREFDNDNKKRKRTIYDDCVQYDINDNHENDQNKNNINNNYSKSDVQSQNHDTEDDDDIEDDLSDSNTSSKMPQEKCRHYIKNHILDSHEKDVKQKAHNYMHDKKMNKKRGALPKWVKQALY